MKSNRIYGVKWFNLILVTPDMLNNEEHRIIYVAMSRANRKIYLLEYFGLMLKEGIYCYIPLVDDDGIDIVFRKQYGILFRFRLKQDQRRL